MSIGTAWSLLLSTPNGWKHWWPWFFLLLCYVTDSQVCLAGSRFSCHRGRLGSQMLQFFIILLSSKKEEKTLWNGAEVIHNFWTEWLQEKAACDLEETQHATAQTFKNHLFSFTEMEVIIKRSNVTASNFEYTYSSAFFYLCCSL